MEERVVLDTNVLVAAIRSSRGASHRLFTLLRTGRFRPALSVALLLEYERQLSEHRARTAMEPGDLAAILDYLCATARHQTVFYRSRPQLRDPKDEMVLEIAAAARCDRIVTFNQEDFGPASSFGIDVATSERFLKSFEDPS